MNNQDMLKVQARFLLFGFVMILSNVLIVVFSWSRRSQFDRRYKIDDVRFYDAVRAGTTNFLAAAIQPNNSNGVSSVSRRIDDVSVVFADLVTWQDFKGGLHCLIDGVEYGKGDYCPLGLVVGIRDARVYVDSSDGVVVVRRKPSGGVEDGTRAARAASAADGVGAD